MSKTIHRSNGMRCWRSHIVPNSRITYGKLSTRRRIQYRKDTSLRSTEIEDVDLVVADDVVSNLLSFLEEDLKHLFDSQGLDKSVYADNVNFEDPITKYDNIDGYLFNIQMLRYLFNPTFKLHNIRKMGQTTIETRWTMDMKFKLLPWQPDLTFTGTTMYEIDLKSKLIVGHKDTWDSIENQEYFSIEGLRELVKQAVNLKQTPSLEAPEYVVLKKTAEYEIRKYKPYIVCETDTNTSDTTTGTGFNTLAAFIFGGNDGDQSMNMTTPVFTTSSDMNSTSKMQFVIESSKYASSDEVPKPKESEVTVKEEKGSICASINVDGLPNQEEVIKAESLLRKAITNDGYDVYPGYQLARYNEPFVLPPFRRNEVIIKIKNFSWTD